MSGMASCVLGPFSTDSLVGCSAGSLPSSIFFMADDGVADEFPADSSQESTEEGINFLNIALLYLKSEAGERIFIDSRRFEENRR